MIIQLLQLCCTIGRCVTRICQTKATSSASALPSIGPSKLQAKPETTPEGLLNVSNNKTAHLPVPAQPPGDALPPRMPVAQGRPPPPVLHCDWAQQPPGTGRAAHHTAPGSWTAVGRGVGLVGKGCGPRTDHKVRIEGAWVVRHGDRCTARKAAARSWVGRAQLLGVEVGRRTCCGQLHCHTSCSYRLDIRGQGHCGCSPSAHRGPLHRWSGQGKSHTGRHLGLLLARGCPTAVEHHHLGCHAGLRTVPRPAAHHPEPCKRI